jgi:hypothetical protein
VHTPRVLWGARSTCRLATGVVLFEVPHAGFGDGYFRQLDG